MYRTTLSKDAPMNDAQTTATILAIEECIDQYIADCHSRVDSFVNGHFSLQETVTLQKQSLVSDLLCHPINALWSIPSLFVKKLIEIPVKIGWRSGADLITMLPTGIKTRYQREIEQLIAMELLEWPGSTDNRQASPNGLLNRITQHQQIAPLLASGALPADTLQNLFGITHLVAEHAASRALVFDATATLLTLLTGWLLFGDHSLGISGIGDQIARNRAKDRAVSTFMFGSSLGSAFYSVFPPKPSFWQVVSATLTVGLFVTTMSLLVGMLSDPWLKRMGFQHTQLNMLIDAVEDHLHRQLRKRLKPALRELTV